MSSNLYVMRSASVISIVLVIAVATTAGNVSAQQPSADTLRREVAKVRVEREGMTAETAAALPVGWSDTRLYLITALHAVASLQSGGVEHKVTAIRLEWPDNPESQPARLYERYDSVLDLAVLSVDLPPGFTRQPVLSEANVQANQPVTLIGHPASGEWSFWSGQVQNENSGSDVARFVYTGSNAPEDGFSGGPLFASNGSLLGIHSATPTPSYGIGIKTGDILRMLTAWRIPTNRFRASLTAPSARDDTNIEFAVRALVNWLAEYQIKVSVPSSPQFAISYLYTNISQPSSCELSFRRIVRGSVSASFDVLIDLSKATLVVDAVEGAVEYDSKAPLEELTVLPGDVPLPVRAREEEGIRQMWLAATRACRQ
jgi:hypothetical protein